MIAVQAMVDWTQVLVVGIPVLLGQIATIVIAILNHRKASDAATTARAAGQKADEVHHQVKPSNGRTLAKTAEEALVAARRAEDNSARLLREQAALATEMGRHLRDHPGRDEERERNNP